MLLRWKKDGAGSLCLLQHWSNAQCHSVWLFPSTGAAQYPSSFLHYPVLQWVPPSCICNSSPRLRCCVLAEAVRGLWRQRIKERRFPGWGGASVSGAWAVARLGQENSLCTLSWKDYLHLQLWQSMHGRAFADSSPFISTSLIFGGEWWHCSGMCSTLPAIASFCDWKNLPVLPLTLGHFCCCLPCNQRSFMLWTLAKNWCGWTWLSSGDALFSRSVPDLVPQATARTQGSL